MRKIASSTSLLFCIRPRTFFPLGGLENGPEIHHHNSLAEWPGFGRNQTKSSGATPWAEVEWPGFARKQHKAWLQKRRRRTSALGARGLVLNPAAVLCFAFTAAAALRGAPPGTKLFRTCNRKWGGGAGCKCRAQGPRQRIGAGHGSNRIPVVGLRPTRKIVRLDDLADSLTGIAGPAARFVPGLARSSRLVGGSGGQTGNSRANAALSQRFH